MSNRRSTDRPALRRGLSLLLACLSLTLGSGSAQAFVPAESSRDLSISIREYDPYQDVSEKTGGADARAASFAARHGGTWRIAAWNGLTGTAHALIGSGVDLRIPFAHDAEVEAAARDFIAENPEVFGAEVANLRTISLPVGYGKRSAHFQQTYHGLDVIGGTVHLVATDAGRLCALGSDFHSGITVDPRPSIPASVAGEIARRGVEPAHGLLLDGTNGPGSDATRAAQAPALCVLPIPTADGTVGYHLAWRVKVWVDDPVGLWATYVDGHDGEILWRYNEVCFADFTGHTSAGVQRPSFCEGAEEETLPYLRVTVEGVGSTYADGNGDWSVIYGGSDPRAVTADLYSPFVDLINTNPLQAAFTGTATPGTALTVAFTDANAQHDERDVYRAVNDIHDYYQAIDPNYPYINQLMPATVSIASTCNAYYVGHTINFYATGGGCANTGEIMGVVHHEFCHGITENLIGGQGSQGIGEGNSDILSNLMTGESMIGRGFHLNCAAGIRDSENTLRYPDDMTGQIHHDGQIIAGFHWDAWQELQTSLPPAEAEAIAANTWHWGRVHSHPQSQPDQVLATFIADDDNGNLLDGTPHYSAFCAAAANHGFVCPTLLSGVYLEHVPIASRSETGDIGVSANAYSTLGSIAADSTQLRYRVNGSAWSLLPMAPTVNPGEFVATISGLVMGDEVEYFLRARDVLGNTGTSPNGAPGSVWSFDLAPFVEHFELENAWAINQDGTDNAVGGRWSLADPFGTSLGGNAVQPEDDRTPDGLQCWITGAGYPGAGAYDSDVDGGRTSLYSVPYDLTGAARAEVKYWRWYTNDLGTNPGGDTWLVQVRNDGGAWTDLENTTTSSNAWTRRSFDLRTLFGSALGVVEFRFVASDVAPSSLVEAAIDEFELQTAMVEAVATPDDGRPRFAFFGARPNPAPGEAGTTIGFRLPAAAAVGVEVFDVSGRQVRRLGGGRFAGGSGGISWDGRDEAGRAVPAGVYYLRLRTPGFEATRPMTLTR